MEPVALPWMVMVALASCCQAAPGEVTNITPVHTFHRLECEECATFQERRQGERTARACPVGDFQSGCRGLSPHGQPFTQAHRCVCVKWLHWRELR
jgi:hypothetical protein